MTRRRLLIAARAFGIPLGVGAHLEASGVPRERIFEHDWWQSDHVGTLEVVSTPSRHFNGRGLPWRTGALWTSWSLVGPAHRVFFSGDTGLTDAFAEIGRREGPFDVALLEIGQWHSSWRAIHLGPEGALTAFERLGAKRLLPIHWATFQLAMHAWSEPAETLFSAVTAAGSASPSSRRGRGVALLTPRLGEPVEPTDDPPPTPWWRALPPTAPRCP